MDRRRLVKSTGSLLAAGLVTGCTGETDYQDGDGSEGGSGEEIEIVEHEISQGGEFEPISVEGVARNTGDSQLSYAEIRVRFYDSEGTLLESSIDNINDVDPGQQWRFEVVYPGMDGEEVAEYDIAAGTSF